MVYKGNCKMDTIHFLFGDSSLAISIRDKMFNFKNNK